MKKEELPNLARKSLSKILDQPGGILYSSHQTLKKGSVYLLGFNPGGQGGHTIGDDIDSMLTTEANEYLDVAWENGNGKFAPGEATLQKGVKWVLDSINLNPREVCASNLVFLRSRTASEVSFFAHALDCWPVHEAILSIVQPKLIIAFGNSETSPYRYLQKMFQGSEESFPSGHGNWKLKGFQTNIQGETIYIAGLPHLSRYYPKEKPFLIDWLSSKL